MYTNEATDTAQGLQAHLSTWSSRHDNTVGNFHVTKLEPVNYFVCNDLNNVQMESIVIMKVPLHLSLDTAVNRPDITKYDA